MLLNVSQIALPPSTFSNHSAPSTFPNRFALFLSQKPICSVPSSLLLTSVLFLFISVSALHLRFYS
ncbi:hypothetical protein L195_g002839 [Trifolium pratense]|uniref:Uncharacterized protein n=1 Tax=Trifolium pratense TaxID=57577 RepID=A0A2K3NPZ6_TRIPR|nr:hypothetical protein L195_g001548 [Trifolium pratense]PNY06374.1 hypothetical protein L195_g002839 [Trifolium pratense]